ncbi:MAG: polyphosphate polymerase domain-containing protein [Eubacteriales bacterium]
MSAQMVFKRYELKYLLNIEQYRALKEIMKAHMALDQFGKHTINNIYFDTDNYLLIRRSLEKPCYKEKLRVRSYGSTNADSKVFVELKKKYDGVVYKRRLDLQEKEALDFLVRDIPLEQPSQISKEVQYFMKYYGTLVPKVYLSYEREAFYGLVNSDFRMTFDQNIRMKEYTELESKDKSVEEILSKEQILLEVKTGMGIPTWLLNFFSENQIYKTSFSKYGRAYEQFLLPKYIKQQKYKEILQKNKELNQKVLDRSQKGGRTYVA